MMQREVAFKTHAQWSPRRVERILTPRTLLHTRVVIMAAFGVVLRPTASPHSAKIGGSTAANATTAASAVKPTPSPLASNTLLQTPVAAPLASPSPPLPSTPALMLRGVSGSLSCASVELLCARLALPLQRTHVSLMRGAGALSDDDAEAKLPSIQDGGVTVTGWISCLRYVAWKGSANANTSDARRTAATATATATATPLPPQFYPMPVVTVSQTQAPPQTPMSTSRVGEIVRRSSILTAQAAAQVGRRGSAMSGGANAALSPPASRATSASVASFSSPLSPAGPLTPSASSPLSPPHAATLSPHAGASPSPSAAAAASSSSSLSSPSSFAIDSVIERFLSFEPSLQALTHVFVVGAARAGHAGPLPFLAHRFDRDGARLVPMWMQQHSAQASATGAAGTHLPLDTEVQAQQHTLERLVRSLHKFIADVQSTLAAHMPAVNSESAVELIRRLETGEDTSTQLGVKVEPTANQKSNAVLEEDEEEDDAASASGTVSSEAPDSAASNEDGSPVTKTPPPADAAATSTQAASVSPASVRFLLGGSTHTLADFVVYFLLQRLPLLHSFLPLLTPATHPHLFVWVSAMTRLYVPHVHSMMGPVTGMEAGKHLLLCRHPMLQVDALTQAGSEGSTTSSTVAATKTDEAASSVAVTSTTAAPVAPHSPSSSVAPSSLWNGPGTFLPSTYRDGPRLTQVGEDAFASSTTTSTVIPQSLSSGSGRSMAESLSSNSTSSLAVEEVADLMDIVERVPHRHRAVTPAWGPDSAANQASQAQNARRTPRSGGSALGGISGSGGGGSFMSSLAWSRVLSQRVVHAVDHAPLSWRCTQDRGQVKLLAPIQSDPDQASYRSMAVSVFPVPPPVLLAFLWSSDCWKLLDPVQVAESRELAPHPQAPSRAKFSYLSLELKSTSTTTSAPATTAGAVADPSSPSPAAPSASASTTVPATATSASPSAVLTKTSSARVDFVLLNSWRRRLDGSYVLLSQSVGEEGMNEINAPKKFTRGAIRGSYGGPDLPSSSSNDAQVPPALAARRLAFQTATGGATGWVLRPFYVDGVTPMCEVTFLSCTSFPARMGAWVGGELERRTAACVLALRNRMKAIMGSHPLVQLSRHALHAATEGAHGDAAHTHGTPAQQQGAGQQSSAQGGVGARAPTQNVPLHFNLHAPVPVSLVHAVSGAGVQSTPHPRAKS